MQRSTRQSKTLVVREANEQHETECAFDLHEIQHFVKEYSFTLRGHYYLRTVRLQRQTALECKCGRQTPSGVTVTQMVIQVS